MSYLMNNLVETFSSRIIINYYSLENQNYKILCSENQKNCQNRVIKRTSNMYIKANFNLVPAYNSKKGKVRETCFITRI